VPRVVTRAAARPRTRNAPRFAILGHPHGTLQFGCPWPHLSPPRRLFPASATKPENGGHCPAPQKNEARGGVIDTAPGPVWSQKLLKSQFSGENYFFLLGSLDSGASSIRGRRGSVTRGGSGIAGGSGSVGRSGASGVGSARSGIAGGGSGITRGSGGIGRHGGGIGSGLGSGGFLLGAGGQHERRKNGAESELRLHLVVPQKFRDALSGIKQSS